MSVVCLFRWRCNVWRIPFPVVEAAASEPFVFFVDIISFNEWLIERMVEWQLRSQADRCFLSDACSVRGFIKGWVLLGMLRECEHNFAWLLLTSLPTFSIKDHGKVPCTVQLSCPGALASCSTVKTPAQLEACGQRVKLPIILDEFKWQMTSHVIVFPGQLGTWLWCKSSLESDPGPDNGGKEKVEQLGENPTKNNQEALIFSSQLFFARFFSCLFLLFCFPLGLREWMTDWINVLERFTCAFKIHFFLRI